MATGTVKWFNAEKGFGFIVQDGGGHDVFVLYSALQSQGYSSFDQAQRVELEVTQYPQGPWADAVRPMDYQAFLVADTGHRQQPP